MINSASDVNAKFLDFLRKKGIREGDRLPAERDLAVRLGTSRPTLRKILRFYEQGKMLERKGRNGTVITKLPEYDYMAYAAKDANPKIVSLVIPDLTYLSSMGNFWKYNFIQEEAINKGYALNAYYSGLDGQSPEKERKYLESLFSISPRGLIAVATCRRPTNDDLFAELQELGVKVVHIEGYRESFPSESFMIPDYRLAGASAVAYLHRSGCRRINLFHTVYSSPSFENLKDGVLAGASAAGISVNDTRQACTGEDFQAGLLDDFCGKIGDDEGVMVNSYYSLKFFAALLERFKKPHPREKKIIAVDFYDEGVCERPQQPFFAFSWKKRISDALEYIASGEKSQVHRLYSPAMLQPESRF